MSAIEVVDPTEPSPPGHVRTEIALATISDVATRSAAVAQEQLRAMDERWRKAWATREADHRIELAAAYLRGCRDTASAQAKADRIERERHVSGMSEVERALLDCEAQS